MMLSFICFKNLEIILLFWATTCNVMCNGEIGAPVVLIPGDGGTQIEARLNKTETVHYLCEKKTLDFFTLWLNLELLLPYVLDCFVDNMRLMFNESSHLTEDSPGVTTRIGDWGNTSSVEWLDPSKNRVGLYYAAIVQQSISWGYTRGKSIRGAPFDFRKAPNEMVEYFANLKALIEETYYSNGNKKIVTIGHSMGNPVSLYFFNRQPQVLHCTASSDFVPIIFCVCACDNSCKQLYFHPWSNPLSAYSDHSSAYLLSWKNKFIKCHISISAPWGGSIKILKLFASGYNMDHYRILLPPSKVRPMQRSFTSSAFLMPSDKFWPQNETLVITPAKNYTSADYKEFFEDIKYERGWTIYEDVGRLTYDLKAPGVEGLCMPEHKRPSKRSARHRVTWHTAREQFPLFEVHCLYGTNLATPVQLVYGKGSFPDYQPEDVNGDGDGTVPTRSLEGCLRWKGEQKGITHKLDEQFVKHQVSEFSMEWNPNVEPIKCMW